MFFCAQCWLLSWVAYAVSSSYGVDAPETCGDNELSAWTSDVRAMPGYHVMCLERSVGACADTADDGTCKADGSGDHIIKGIVCWNGLRTECEDFALETDSKSTSTQLLSAEERLISQRPVVNSNRYQRIKKGLEKKGTWKGIFAFFSVGSDSSSAHVPARIRSPDQMNGLVLAYEGGSFIWPGVKAGFSRSLTLAVDGVETQVSLLTRSLQPLVIEVSSFLETSDCEHIIAKATPHIAKSKVSHMDHDVGKPDTNWRSSSTYFMPSDDKVLKLLDSRVSVLTATPVKNQEYSQILRYERGEAYSAHTDYFDPDMYKKSEQIQGMTKKGLFNRLATVFFYLTTVEAGGHTNFPRAGGRPQPHNFDDCSNGVSVEPQQGRIIIFYSQDAAAQLDPYSLHGGCSVTNGTKWSANKWIWNKGMNFL